MIGYLIYSVPRIAVVSWNFRFFLLSALGPVGVVGNDVVSADAAWRVKDKNNKKTVIDAALIENS